MLDCMGMTGRRGARGWNLQGKLVLFSRIKTSGEISSILETDLSSRVRPRRPGVPLDIPSWKLIHLLELWRVLELKVKISELVTI